MTGSSKFELSFVGVGVVRGGSTWLHSCLNEHPDICMATPKETNFFNRSEDFTEDIEKYRKKYFSTCDMAKICGEFTPSYFHHEKALKRIQSLFPNSKIIVCLRDPAQRAYSHFLKHFERGKNFDSDFEKSLEKNPEVYIEPGFYYKHMVKLFEIFNKKQVHVIRFEDITNNPRNVLRDLYNFLEVDSSFVPDSLEKKVNSYGAHNTFIPLLNKIIFKLERNGLNNKFLSWLRPVAHRLKVRKLSAFITNINTRATEGLQKKKPIPISAHNYLIKIYKEDIAKLEMLLQKDFSGWLLREE